MDIDPINPENVKTRKSVIVLGVVIAVITIGAGIYYFIPSVKESIINLSVSLSNSKANVGDPVLTLQPSITDIEPGDEFTVNVIIDTKTRTIAGAELHIDFPATMLQGISIQNGSFLPTELVAGAIVNGRASITLLQLPGKRT